VFLVFLFWCYLVYILFFGFDFFLQKISSADALLPAPLGRPCDHPHVFISDSMKLIYVKCDVGSLYYFRGECGFIRSPLARHITVLQ
jgi:hypothetical protein